MYLYDYPYAISKDIVAESITDKEMVLSEQYLYYVSWNIKQYMIYYKVINTMKMFFRKYDSICN